MSFSIESITVGDWSENTYCLKSGNQTLVIDPGDDFSDLLRGFNLSRNDSIDYLLATHGHFDHIGAAAEFQKMFKVPFGIHKQDQRLVTRANLYRKIAGNDTIVETPTIDFFLEDQQTIEWAGHKIVVHHLPGHSKGHVVFEIDHQLFSGDIFLDGELGRTDLPGGNRTQLEESGQYIFEKFAGFTLHPGHGKSFVLDEDHVNTYKEQLS